MKTNTLILALALLTTISVKGADSQNGNAIVINELMASNAGVVMSPATNFDSWIELYNPGDEAIDLGDMWLSNDAEKPMLWQLPADFGVVPAKGFKVVWLGSNDVEASQPPFRQGFQAPFKLDCDGGTILLSNADGTLITSQDYFGTDCFGNEWDEALSRSSWARTTDGGDEWGWTADATPEATNTTSAFAATRLDPPVVSVGSRLFQEPFDIEVTIPEGATLMYTTDGSMPMTAVYPDPSEGSEGTEGSEGSETGPVWTNFVKNGDCEGDDATCLVSYNGDEKEDVNRIEDGVGFNGSRGVKVHSIDDATDDWDTQFFVYTPDHVWQIGEQYRFRFKVRADKAAHVSVQTHSTPHNYLYWEVLDNGYDVTEKWQEFSYEGTISEQQVNNGDLQTITFNLNVLKEENNYYFDDISWELYAEVKPEETNPWTEFVINSDCEGDDAQSFYCKDADDPSDVYNAITDGVGYNGSRGIKIHSVDGPEHEWDAQFFVYTPNHIWKEGEHYRFSMMVRADVSTRISAQAHRTPGDYIHWQMLDNNYNIGTQWQKIEYEGDITTAQAGDGLMQTIAFNLNEEGENNFYFDNISWQLLGTGNDVADTGTAQRSDDGKFTVDGTKNYVFRLFQEGYLPSVPVTRSYIQTYNEYTIPVVSIVGDERYFTDPMWGIDIKGQNGIPGNGDDDQPKNWNQPWDRPVNFSYISPTDGMLFNQDVNVSISGGWTRSSSPRSMKLKSNKVFDGLNHLDYVFFPQKPYIRSKTLLVRNGGNDVYSGSRFMDPALTTIIQRSGIDLDVQSFVQVVEYVNGKFKGVLNLREPNNDKFVYANFGYDDEEIDMFENSTFKNGTAEVYERLVGLSEHINDAGVYEEVKTMLDIDEFTNYMAAELYIGNDDWPENNVKAYRSQKDGRFRFVCFDLDYALNEWGRSLATLNDYEWVDMVKLFLNLLQHDEFRRKFIDTFCIMGGSVFERERATAIVDELADAMRPMSQYDGKLPDNSANKIKNKLKNRVEDMTSQLQQYAPMQLGGARKQSVQLSTDTEGATLTINDIKVPYASFDGRLFAPVTLEATAPVGYTFAGWKKSSASLTTIVNNNANWRYYDKGEAAEGWQGADFDDSTWTLGEAPLGYAPNDYAMSDIITTAISYGDNDQEKHPTTYFRHTVNLSKSPTDKDYFVMNYQVDDGFVIYVNGTEAGRVNMRQGEVNYNSFSQTYAGDMPMEGAIELPVALFHKGSNVLAIEVHNTSLTSSDLFWAADLQTTVSDGEEEYVSMEPVIDLPDDAKVSLVATFTPMTEEELAANHVLPVRINEVSAANGIYMNEYFKRNDWVELYNTTDQPIDVAGMYLSDNPKKPTKYQIPSQSANDDSESTTVGGDLQSPTIIPAHGYLIIWCDNLDPLSQLHASFKLDADSGEVLLTAADGSWSDHFVYTKLSDDETAGRYPDGADDVYVMNIPTIAKANIMSSYAIAVEQPVVTGIIDMMAQQEGSERIYNLKGQAVQGALAPGIYIKNGRKFIKK